MTLALRFSSPFYAHRAEIACGIILGLFVWGVYDRGLKSVTNLLLLIPGTLWLMEAAYAGDAWLPGFWPVLLYGSTFITLLIWVLVQTDRDMA